MTPRPSLRLQVFLGLLLILSWSPVPGHASHQEGHLDHGPVLTDIPMTAIVPPDPPPPEHLTRSAPALLQVGPHWGYGWHWSHTCTTADPTPSPVDQARCIAHGSPHDPHPLDAQDAALWPLHDQLPYAPTVYHVWLHINAVESQHPIWLLAAGPQLLTATAGTTGTLSSRAVFRWIHLGTLSLAKTDTLMIWAQSPVEPTSPVLLERVALTRTMTAPPPVPFSESSRP